MRSITVGFISCFHAYSLLIVHIHPDSVMEEREKVMREAMETPWRKLTAEEQEEIIVKEKNFIFGQLGSYCTSCFHDYPDACF